MKKREVPEHIPLEQVYEKSPWERVQNKEGKWNLKHKKTGDFIVPDKWYDSVSLWNSYSRGEYNTHGWNTSTYLNTPLRTPNSAYRYCVLAEVTVYTLTGVFLESTRIDIGIHGILGDNIKK